MQARVPAFEQVCEAMALMGSMKKVMDPHLIVNPHKVLPSSVL